MVEKKTQVRLVITKLTQYPGNHWTYLQALIGYSIERSYVGNGKEANDVTKTDRRLMG